ncbi:MAG: type II secretion system protein [Luteolibacter sp.]
MKHNRQHKVRHRTGFTLVELLVVLAIITVLAILSVTITGRIRLAAAKSRSIGQMRSISIGIATWMGEKSAMEPFYVANGTGDFPHESLATGVFRPGNPARALYNKTDPSAGYIQDFNVFFTPLATVPAGLPTQANYDPANASNSRVWGTFAYFFPHVTEPNKTARHIANGVQAVPSSRASVDGKLMMSEFYEGNWITPRFGKEIHHILLSDWSVQYVADSNTQFNKWKSGN